MTKLSKQDFMCLMLARQKQKRRKSLDDIAQVEKRRSERVSKRRQRT